MSVDVYKNIRIQGFIMIHFLTSLDRNGGRFDHVVRISLNHSSTDKDALSILPHVPDSISQYLNTHAVPSLRYSST